MRWVKGSGLGPVDLNRQPDSVAQKLLFAAVLWRRSSLHVVIASRCTLVSSDTLISVTTCLHVVDVRKEARHLIL